MNELTPIPDKPEVPATLTNRRLESTVRSAETFSPEMKITEQGDLVRYEIGIYYSDPPTSIDELGQVKASFDAALQPAHRSDIIRCLHLMRARTIHRASDDTDLALVIEAYADALSRYPLDAIKQPCDDLARTNKFWPALAEIIEGIDRLNAWRTTTRDSLQTSIDKMMRNQTQKTEG